MRLLFAATTVLALSATLGLGQDAPKQIKKVGATYTSPASGPEMFRSYCAACHGLDAKGTGPAAPALTKAPADLTLLARKHGGKYPAADVEYFITGETVKEAHGSRDMPIWGDVFRGLGANQGTITQLRVKNLSDYIGTLQQK